MLYHFWESLDKHLQLQVLNTCMAKVYIFCIVILTSLRTNLQLYHSDTSNFGSKLKQ